MSENKSIVIPVTNGAPNALLNPPAPNPLPAPATLPRPGIPPASMYPGLSERDRRNMPS